MNKYGRYGVPVPWDAIKTLWCTGEKSCVELGQIFGVVPNTITTRARREKWHKLLAQVRESTAPSEGPKADSLKAEQATDFAAAVTSSSIPGRIKTSMVALGDEVVVQRAREISGSDHFRSRVITMNNKALTVLENNEPTNVGEVDRFAEALTKVERIGARTYGYDRESERPVINIGVLSGGNEYSVD